MFRVVPDQLRVSEGWVRCGACDEVFDASAHLQPVDDQRVTPAVVVRSESPVAETISMQAEVAVTASVAETPAQAPEEDSFLQERPAEPPPADTVRQPFALNMSALGDVLPPSESPGVDHLRFVQADAPVPVSDHPSVADLSFMRKRSSRTLGEQPAGRRWLGLGCVLATVLLVLQLTVFERERIASMQPAFRPVLAALCGVLGCQLNGLQQMESLVIDSSGFAKVRADVYRLSFSLRNSANLAVAMPALELTLTDSQDQPVLRRVLLASDFAAHQSMLAAGAELGVSLPVAVGLSGGDKFSGYRLLAFYP